MLSRKLLGYKNGDQVLRQTRMVTLHQITHNIVIKKSNRAHQGISAEKAIKPLGFDVLKNSQVLGNKQRIINSRNIALEREWCLPVHTYTSLCSDLHG